MSPTLTGAAPGGSGALRGQDPTPEQLAGRSRPRWSGNAIAEPGREDRGDGRPHRLPGRAARGRARVRARLTFTNKAASEPGGVRDSLAEIPIDGDEITVDTYHAFAADLVKAYGIRVGVEVDADLLSEPSSTRSCSASSTASGSST